MAKYKQRADGRYCTNIDLGYDADGKRIRKMLYGKSVRELDQKISDFKIQVATGTIDRSKQTVSEYADMWLTTYKSSTELQTQNMYKYAIKHIKDSAGHIPLVELRTSDIQKIINDNADHPETCKKIKLTIKQIIERAIEDDIIQKNIARNIEIPKNNKSKKRALTDREKNAIFNAELNDKDKAFVYLLYYFGLRKEEALALTKTDFDFKKNKLYIRKALQIGDTRDTTLIKDTKNKSSEREIPIPDVVISFFKEFLKTTNAIHLFLDKNGNLPTKSSTRKTWDRIIRALNDTEATDNEKKLKIKPIEGLTAHIFRHNYATMLYYSDIGIKEAANLMGHSDTKMIMEIYAHLDEEKAETTTKINKMFSEAQ